jgi:tagatose-1,6-bisphosphate aldolase
VLPTGIMLRRHTEMTKLKLFNYWVQNLETKINTHKIERLREVIEEAQSKLILITYDAFLFDYSIQDGKDFLVKVKEILEEGGFKVKHKHAKNYFFN